MLRNALRLLTPYGVRLRAFALSLADQHAQTILHAWADKDQHALARYRKLLADLQLAGTLDPAMLTVALREIRCL